MKIRSGYRITPEEGLFLLKNAELLDLADLANEIRFKKNPDHRVTFVIDTNPNYSNICDVDCIFCAFYRHAGEEGEYTYSVDRMIQNFKAAAAKGVTTVLLQGGVNPALPFEYYLDMVRRTIAEVPGIYPHFYSTSEIIGMSHVANLPIRDVLVYSGAKFLCPCAGEISLMPGTASNPGFRRVDVDVHTGKVTGLF